MSTSKHCDYDPSDGTLFQALLLTSRVSLLTGNVHLYLFRILTRRGFPRSDYVCTKCLHTQGFEFWGLGIPHWHVTKMIIKVSPKHLFWWLVMLLCGELWGIQPATAIQWQYSQVLVRSFQNFVIPVLALEFPFQISVNLIPKLAMSPLEMKTYPNGKDQDEKKFNQVWKYSNNLVDDSMVYKRHLLTSVQCTVLF